MSFVSLPLLVLLTFGQGLSATRDVKLEDFSHLSNAVGEWITIVDADRTEPASDGTSTRS